MTSVADREARLQAILADVPDFGPDNCYIDQLAGLVREVNSEIAAIKDDLAYIQMETDLAYGHIGEVVKSLRELRVE